MSIPRRCTCCGVRVLRSDGLVVPYIDRALRFPSCGHCLEHQRMWQSADPYASGVALAWLGAATLAVVSVLVAVCLAVLATVLLRTRARAQRRRAHTLMTRDCACPDVPVRFVGDSCWTVELSFASVPYATSFARENSRSLVEVDARVRAVAAIRWTPPVNMNKASGTRDNRDQYLVTGNTTEIANRNVACEAGDR